MRAPSEVTYLGYDDVRFIHLVLVDDFFSKRFGDEITRYGILKDDMLHSAVGRPMGTFDGRELYPTVPYKAAALMHSIINNHPFVDANKRTGVLCAWVFMSLNGIVKMLDQDQLYEIAMDVEANRLDVDSLGSILTTFFVG